MSDVITFVVDATGYQNNGLATQNPPHQNLTGTYPGPSNRDNDARMLRLPEALAAPTPAWRKLQPLTDASSTVSDGESSLVYSFISTGNFVIVSDMKMPEYAESKDPHG
ncbi:hypothetical protein JVT61DRAFT_2680 [Boletus reticuloceps]|uniref:Uncharacterized protein n=1 Tax=Boletus reticuloceps TaxID=495285 RepID=A0A8I2YRU9_9AGAM|nr:hypothetical protein JVT61DRAFT_2680 [Boletus reticuloceps]